MNAVRKFIARRHLAALLCAATLLLKVLLPTGYMVASNHGQLAITICPGVVEQAAGFTMPGMHGEMMNHGKSKDYGKAEMPCAFSGLSAATLGAVDPLLLVGLIAFIVAVGLGPAALLRPLRPNYLRPPLRGPPAYL